MAKYFASTNSMPGRRAQMRRERLAGSRPSGFTDDTYESKRIVYIGRESNRLEEIEAGIIHSPESVYTEYPDPNRDEWETRILPVLKKIPIAALMRVSGKSRSMLTRALAGRSRRRKRNQQLLKSILRRLGLK